MRKEIVALGNTASVMSTLSEYLGSIRVGYAPVMNPEVIQLNQNCFAIPGTNTSSVSWLKVIGRQSRPGTLFHAELQYAPSCQRAGVPYGVHIHGTTDAKLLYPGSRLGILLKSSFRRSLEHAEYVLTHEMLTGLVRRLRPDAVVFQSPVDLRQFSPLGGKRRLGRLISFLSPSRMDQWKGHDVIWAALRLMRNAAKVQTFQSDWGWEPQYSRLKRTAPPNVKLVPVVPRGLIAEHYRGADVVIGQMQLGYLGLAELEAAACGVPVVAYSKDQGSPFLPKRSDPSELASFLDRLVEDADYRAKYASSCRDYVSKNHDAKRLAYEFLSIVSQQEPTRRGGLGAKDLLQLELGTGLELAELVLGSPSKHIRKTLLSL